MKNAIDNKLIQIKNVDLYIPVNLSNNISLNGNLLKTILNFQKPYTRKFVTLLSEINFDLMAGERVGIMGLNGAGKSTFLRLLAGIYYPSVGEIHRRGSIKGLFDVTLGTNPAATGRENIMLRALQMGMTHSEAKELIPDVIAFSELKDHVDKPMATYSQGMKMRLILSISTLISPDVLLLDEWIGAGDNLFNQKMKKRMDELIEESKSIVLATHNFQLMKALCTRGIVMDQGKIIFDGDLHSGHSVFREIYQASRK